MLVFIFDSEYVSGYWGRGEDPPRVGIKQKFEVRD